MKKLLAIVLGLAFAAAAGTLCAQGLDAALQSKIDAHLKLAQTLAAAPVIVESVRAQNTSLPPERAAMTQEAWKASSIMDPVIKSLLRNPVTEYIKQHKDPAVAEAFVSDAEGRKVAFLGKTTGWSHKGKAKHDKPMQGQTWVGEIETDASTGLQQIQIAVPVIDGGKPIGSLVMGLALSKLK